VAASVMGKESRERLAPLGVGVVGAPVTSPGGTEPQSSKLRTGESVAAGKRSGTGSVVLSGRETHRHLRSDPRPLDASEARIIAGHVARRTQTAGCRVVRSALGHPVLPMHNDRHRHWRAVVRWTWSVLGRPVSLIWVMAGLLDHGYLPDDMGARIRARIRKSVPCRK